MALLFLCVGRWHMDRLLLLGSVDMYNASADNGTSYRLLYDVVQLCTQVNFSKRGGHGKIAGSAQTGYSYDRGFMNPQWLAWVQQLQAIAQNGLAYSDNIYDIERYEQLQGLAAEILASHTDMDSTVLHDLFRAETGYATPKVDVRGAVFQQGKILLVKERADGRWTLPGGWADVGDSPATAVVREIEEESGFQTKVAKLVALYDRDHPRHGHPPLAHHIYKLFFQCDIIGGAPRKSAETEAVGFFDRDALPELSVTRVVASQITRLFTHYKDPSLPTDFD